MPEPPNHDDCQAAAHFARRANPPYADVLVADAQRHRRPRGQLKAELFRRTGSFKLRGAINRVASLTREERAGGAVTASAGNHGQAAALACAEAGIDVVVFMPSGASPAKVAATRGCNATVDLEAANGAEAFARMHSLAAETGRTVLAPFDDPLVMAGQATVGLEICAEIRRRG